MDLILGFQIGVFDVIPWCDFFIKNCQKYRWIFFCSNYDHLWFFCDYFSTKNSKFQMKNYEQNEKIDVSKSFIFRIYNSAKDEGLGACAQTRVRRRIFRFFPWWWGLKSSEVRSTSVSFAITLSAQPISYHNQHSLTQPYCNFSPFPLFFLAQTKFVSLLLLIWFFWLATIQLEVFF